MRRLRGYVALALVMAAAGAAVYGSLLSAHATAAGPPKKPSDPEAVTHQVVLPGTLVLAHSGALYGLSGGTFRELTAEEGWTQPAFGPAGTLLAVRRGPTSADVYELPAGGAAPRKLTDNAAPALRGDLSGNHWSFYPRLSTDGRTLFMSYDSPKNGYEVGLSVWAMPVGAGQRQARRWTTHANYTGGDVEPLPLPSGAVLYTRYSYDETGTTASQLWLTSQPLSPGRALTDSADACSQAALSPDGQTLAMICTHGTPTADLVLAPFDGGAVGALRVVGSGIVGRPTWAPDGNGIVYLAPAVGGEPFQLWWLPLSTTRPIQITRGLAFDATSAPAWRP